MITMSTLYKQHENEAENNGGRVPERRAEAEEGDSMRKGTCQAGVEADRFAKRSANVDKSAPRSRSV